MTDISVLERDIHQFDYRGEGPRSSQQWALRYMLFLRDVTAVFDGFKALDIEDLGIGHNELRVVVGPNGAGKTTMCDVISGLTRPTTGQVYFNGQDITALSDTRRAQLGIGRKFQIPNVFDSLTVWENMLLALPNPCLEIGSPAWFSQRRSRVRGPAAVAAIRLGTMIHHIGGRSTSENVDRIHALLKRVHLYEHLHVPARSLSHGQRQWLAISKLVIAEPRLLLVDEPAAGLTDRETELTADLLLELKGSHTLIVIEHDMDFVRRLNARVTVLNEGRLLADGPLDDVQADPRVIEAYLGR